MRRNETTDEGFDAHVDEEATENGGDTTVVRVRGSLDLATLKRLESVVTPLLGAGGPRRLLLDLAEVPFVDSAALGGLVRFRHGLAERGEALVLRHCRPEVRHALDVTRLARLFEVAP